MAEKHFADGAGVDVFGWPAVGQFSFTAAGFAPPAPTGIGRFMVLGHMVAISLPAISGSSNSGDFTLTGLDPAVIPFADRNADCVQVTDKGKAVVGTATVQAGGALRIWAGAPGTIFASSGAKALGACELKYLR